MSREGRMVPGPLQSKACLVATDNLTSQLHPRAALGLEAEQKSPAEQKPQPLGQDEAVFT